MAPRSIRKALGAVKDQTSIGLAKVAGSSVPELEVAVVKATSHDEVPVDDKYVQELLYLTSYSRGYVNACLGLLARRLGKTRNWVVALKTLMVTHRLLREADSTFEEELARIGRRMLCLSGFTDESRSNAWDYTAFVRVYALYLDERLDCHVFASGSGQATKRSGYDGYGHSRSSYDEYRYSDREYYDERRRDSPQRQTQNQLKTKEMKPDMLLEKLPVMQRIMERVLACRPAGAARYHRLTQIALYLVIRESFQLYAEICDGIAVLLEAFFDMEYQDSTKAFDIYAKSAKQGEELASFYNVCKQIGVGRSSDYPTIVKISQDHLDTLEDSLRERSRSGSRPQRPKSPEPSPPPKEESEPEDVDYNGMKALPAPPVEPVPEPEPPKPEEKDADLLNLDKSNMVAEGDRLALALFSDAPAANGNWEPFGAPQANGVAHHSSASENGKAGWELALVTEASSLAKATPTNLAGGFDKLLLDSMYEQGTVTQKSSASIPAGSASSVAIPGKPTNYLALPAPTGTIDEDPFSASLTVPPPPFVQMADMQQKQRFLVQEQQLWNQYQQNGMQGQFGYTSYYNNMQYNPAYYQGMGMGGYGGYGYGYNY